MKYQHRQSLEIAVSAEFDEKFKTYLVTLQDGSTKNVSSSTFKRWWKKLDDDVEVGTPEANAIANDIEAILDDENNAGDGTPLNEVGREIAEQAKQKAEQAKLVPMPGTTDPDWGKKHVVSANKSKKEKVAKADIAEVKATIGQLIVDTGFTVKTYSGASRNYTVKNDAGKTVCEVYFGSKKVALMLSASKVPEGYTADRVRNCPNSHAFDFTYSELDKFTNLLKIVKEEN